MSLIEPRDGYSHVAKNQVTYDTYTAFHLRLTKTAVNGILLFILINEAVVVIIIISYGPDVIEKIKSTIKFKQLED